jgi:hypothetical protein
VGHPEVVDREPVGGLQHLADALSVAGAGVGLVAEQATPRGGGGRRGLDEGLLRIGAGEALLDDVPEQRPSAQAVGLAAGSGRAERTQMEIADPRLGQTRLQLPLGEAGAA